MKFVNDNFILAWVSVYTRENTLCSQLSVSIIVYIGIIVYNYTTVYISINQWLH